MELPITRPSMMCYADELKFPDLLNDLSSKKHNGFIRITAGSEEGFILFKEGKEIAASYIRYSRVDAIEKIKSAMEDKTTLIEVFDVRPTQIDFFMDMNKPYIIGLDAYDLIDKFKRPQEEKKELEPRAVPKPKPVSDAFKENSSNPKEEQAEEQTVSEPPKNIIPTPNNTLDTSNTKTETVEPVKLTEDEKIVSEDVPEIKKIEPIKEPITETKPIPEIVETESVSVPIQKPVPEKKPVSEIETKPEIIKSESEISNDPTSQSILNSQESSEETETLPPENNTKPSMDRSELMKKYGIKDIQEEDVTNILESYKGGSVSDEDVEKIELTLMNKIKKSTLSIPKIRGAEVMVFLDNAERLTGKVNIIIESENQGFLSRIMGDSNKINLERQIIEISQIEIRKSFRKYPEIVDDFNINVEIS
jgi:Uncharacterized protein conserved in archaea (DUF2226)